MVPGANDGRQRWRLRAQSGLRVARFGSEAVVFNPASWQTHLLNDPAVRVIEALMSGPQTLDDLLVAALGDVGPREREAEVLVVESLLSELEALSLIELDH